MLSSILNFPTSDQAQKLLLAEDHFTQSWSEFDVASRLGKIGGSKNELLAFVAAQALEWTEDEKLKIEKHLKAIDRIIQKQGYKLPFPKEIQLIKSTMKEEGGAMGYTRGNYIVLNESLFSKEDAYIQKLLVHELFHVLTRNNPAFRKAMYQLIGFQLIDPIPYPAPIINLRITNPDAPQTDSYIMLSVGDKTVPCTMVLYANKPYEGGRFFDYLQTGFLQLNQACNAPEYDDGAPIIHTINEVKNFYEQVGRNTNYIIHPEEILADNFAFAVLGKEGLEDAWLTDNIKSLLKR